METKITFPSHLNTRAWRPTGKNKSSARMMARCMRRNLPDACDYQIHVIATNRRAQGLFS